MLRSACPTPGNDGSDHGGPGPDRRNVLRCRAHPTTRKCGQAPSSNATDAPIRTSTLNVADERARLQDLVPEESAEV